MMRDGRVKEKKSEMKSEKEWSSERKKGSEWNDERRKDYGT